MSSAFSLYPQETVDWSGLHGAFRGPCSHWKVWRTPGWAFAISRKLEIPSKGECCSHRFQDTNSLRRTMQIVECSLLHRQAEGRVSS